MKIEGGVGCRKSRTKSEKYKGKILEENTSLTGIRCAEEDAGWVDCKKQSGFVSLKCKLD